MTLNFSNTNAIWASVLAETLYRLGLTTAIICPGSRSTPLAIAFAQHPQIEAIPILDERSAAFFALGRARQTHLPVVLVCTSGTAGANFYPAVIEARESRVPLLVLTGDRPPEMRDCNAGQTIDQQKLFGSYPNWYSELAVPSLDLLPYLRQVLLQSWERALYPVAGAVHLNLPFRDPLAPKPQAQTQAFSDHFPTDFFEAIEITPSFPTPHSFSIPPEWLQSDRGILIAGVAQPHSSQNYCAAIAHLCKTLGLPVLAEALSPLRNFADLNPYLISTYPLLLRDTELADKLASGWVIRVGEMPTSKELRQWLAKTQPRQWVVDGGDRNLDPLHGKTTHLRLSVEQLAMMIPLAHQPNAYRSNAYRSLWCEAEQQLREAIDRTLSETTDWFEGKAAWLMSQHLPPATPLFIANSMPIRDMECFWKPSNLQIQPFFNRGANGIDGTLSTALGVAHRQQNSSVLLTGDLALLHDTNGFLIRHKFVGHLTIVLINNNGGGIFESLPIAQFDPPLEEFEEFFATPQAIDFAKLCATYNVEHEVMQSWQQFVQRLNPLPAQGVRVLEIRTDRKADAQWRRGKMYR
ncbi:MAG: 2-succinyl-5-enolpyruvyl-6-hydroxy-3-cyclohexene-1-carboxylic-acid synthase [Drouetiella hepatica Uher 2000/2452]|jgi:2-succinyl-5-enolpyruvyl-6-hydroxy-3-cyclohexene-1-carboxylate synthase|uniref:2-succinyl-5-enolpyruvyl-6-hydroxy-3-cyclohexene-1-carboxylate synthase n=1 Tax=Drouetiella hepatica Uher 2000/2452 TaxID=904376 RepID=A0A951Q624_9CYAN|nr:2-succinyl-5-enolpyruvyl-6-hydroxy-3-cyclohexene-1-carboxylic-acid synthase [Drouetiella hepatica Uher 2000/2452]